MMEKCVHEWVEDNEGIVACFFCGKEGEVVVQSFMTDCVECGGIYPGIGGKGLCDMCSESLGMHEEIFEWELEERGEL